MTTTLITSDKDGNKWFSEVNDQWPGQCFSLQIEEVLLDQKTEYQHLQVFKSVTYGNVLVLDGVIQLTTRDEAAYQEMIAHIPLFAHKNPRSVLIIGGGDGGVIREVVKHKSVERIVICEIDRAVIEAGKKYFPSVASSWDDERVTLVTSDASVFIKSAEQANAFDVIICDTSDPVGPAEALFEMPFYQDLFTALKPGGRVCTQAETVWVHLPLIQKMLNGASDIFKDGHVEYATTQIPTYPCGMIGFLVCTKADGSKLNPSCVHARPGDVDEMKLRYYSAGMHLAAFVLPKFAEDALRPTINGNQQSAPTSISTGKNRSLGIVQALGLVAASVGILGGLLQWRKHKKQQ